MQRLLDQGSQAVWSAAALALALGDTTPIPVRGAADEVLQAQGVEADAVRLDPQKALLSVRATTSLLQAADALRSGARWSHLPDDVLLDQGRASAHGAGVLIEHFLPRLPGLMDALKRPGARMLDVGTGTAALAVAYARALPELGVVGVDVLPRALEIGRHEVASSDVAERVELRQQDVADLSDPDSYDLAWLPAPFIPEPSLATGVPAVARSLHSGGWLLMAHGKFAGDPIEDALTRLQTALYGGSALDDQAAQHLLASAGLTDVATAPTPPGAPAITVGRKPE